MRREILNLFCILTEIYETFKRNFRKVKKHENEYLAKRDRSWEMPATIKMYVVESKWRLLKFPYIARIRNTL